MFPGIKALTPWCQPCRHRTYRPEPEDTLWREGLPWACTRLGTLLMSLLCAGKTQTSGEGQAGSERLQLPRACSWEEQSQTPLPLPQDMAALHHTALLLVAPGFAGVADPASQAPTPFPTGGPVPLRIKHAGPALLIRVALGCGLGAPILPWRSQSAYRNPPRLPQGSKEA